MSGLLTDPDFKADFTLKCTNSNVQQLFKRILQDLNLFLISTFFFNVDQCDAKVQAMESEVQALKSTLVDLSCELCDPIKTSGCDSNGRCICLEGYRGTRCNDCNTGYERDASGLCKEGMYYTRAVGKSRHLIKKKQD